LRWRNSLPGRGGDELGWQVLGKKVLHKMQEKLSSVAGSEPMPSGSKAENLTNYTMEELLLMTLIVVYYIFSPWLLFCWKIIGTVDTSHR
jgi:hypothetical protein